jgi:hypothetical protein
MLSSQCQSSNAEWQRMAKLQDQKARRATAYAVLGIWYSASFAISHLAFGI